MRVAKIVLLFLLLLAVILVGVLFIYVKNIPSLSPSKSILVLGKGGEGHTAPNLTDTIMLVTLDNSKKDVKVLSLPRDLWIPQIRAKLNTAYFYGGFEMLSESVNSITDTQATDMIVVDFSLFKDIIDSLGGVEVDVVNSFTDERYPIAGKENDTCNGDKSYKCRYETLSFSKGLQTMDGQTALKFVRSRNANGDEGTDLAREKRQQQLISALKNKILSPDFLLSPKRIKSLYLVFSSHMETTIDKKDIPVLVKFLYENKDNIKFMSIPEEFIQVSQNDVKYDRQYVFVPKNGSWSEFKVWFKNY